MPVAPIGIGLFPPAAGAPLAGAPSSVVVNASNITAPFLPVAMGFGIVRRQFTPAEWRATNATPIQMVTGVANVIVTPLWGVAESNVPTNGSLGGIAYGIYAGNGAIVGNPLTSTFNGMTGVTAPPHKLVEQFVQAAGVAFTDLTRNGLGLVLRGPDPGITQANSVTTVTIAYVTYTPVVVL